MSVSSQVPLLPPTKETRGIISTLTWEVPSWVLSESSQIFLTFSSSSWGFGAYVQLHQILYIHWGK